MTSSERTAAHNTHVRARLAINVAYLWSYSLHCLYI